MFKRYKLLVSLVSFTALGIILVLGFWLYASYNTRKDLFFSQVERSLFNVLQKTYLERNPNVFNPQKFSRSPEFEKELKNALSHKLSDDDIEDIFQQLSEAHNARIKKEREARLKEENASGANPKNSFRREPFVAPFFLRNFEITYQVKNEIAVRLDSVLQAKRIHVPFKLDLMKISKDDFQKFNEHVKKEHLNWTNPIFVNPAKGQFLVVKFDSVFWYLLFDLSWQLLVAVLLVGLLIGTFIYLFQTIFQQNKLAVLRKSFVDNMTHELKTPVSTVMAAMEALQLYGGKDDPVKLDRYLTISRKELEHLSTMIEKVLQMDIGDQSSVKLYPASMNLVTLLQECADAFRMSSGVDISVSVKSDPQDYFILADGAHLKNVFSNLLDNAIKYGANAVQVNLSQIKKTDMLKIEVVDNGCGIAKMYHQQVFELFFRVPEGNLHNVKGFGLGLAYVKQVIQLHQGKIEVESVLQEGSVFTIQLPMDRSK